MRIFTLDNNVMASPLYSGYNHTQTETSNSKINIYPYVAAVNPLRAQPY